MIDFSRANLTHLAIHHVGNKGLGEELTLSNKLIKFKDDFVKETLLRYLLSPFKTDVYYQFKGKADISLQSIQNACEDMFQAHNQSDYKFLSTSKDCAQHLYNQSLHPKIKGGHFYVANFKDVVCDGELVDCVGFFKTEKVETFLKIDVNPEFEVPEIDCDSGIDPAKLDKGCLVFNTDKNKGYKISIIDTNNKNAECHGYWPEDFLNAKLKPNGYYHTRNFIDAAVGFCEEVLTEANNVTKENQAMMLNKMVKAVSEKDKLNIKDFNREVLNDVELITQFDDYRAEFAKRLDLAKFEDEFDVSQTAVKQNKKYVRTVIKLDKNFHLYIHAHHELFEKGYDEEKAMKFYKVYYVNEE